MNVSLRRPSVLALLAVTLAGAVSGTLACTPAGGGDAGAPDGGVVDAGPGPQCMPLAAHLTEMPAEPWTSDCTTLTGDARYLCGETWFWAGLSLDFNARPEARAKLSAIIDAGIEPGHERDLGRMHALRGQLTLAMVLENGTGSLVGEINPDFERAVALDPANGIIATWKDSVDIALTWRLGDRSEMPALMERTWANVEQCRMGNILSISGTTIGLPLDTGIPQATIERLDGWTCDAAEFCYGNTWRAPYTMPGLAYHFGEAYARMGDRDRARSFLEEALVAEGAAQWPFRAMAQDTLAHLDEVVDEFVDLGTAGDAFDRMYANQSFGCVFCHSTAPPADLVRTTRIGAPEAPPVDAGPGPGDVDAGPLANACNNEADIAALDTHQDPGAASQSCAIGCVTNQDPLCEQTCVEDNIGVSTGCAACFADMIACTLDNCLLQCAAGASPTCNTCQENNCFPGFVACAGISPP